jgi:hypothetical protein
MKKFVSENWYKLMIGSSLLMASFGFMVHSVSPAMADDNNQKLNVNSNYKLVPTNSDGSINVKLSDEQLDKIIPKNEDGSINVKVLSNSKEIEVWGSGNQTRSFLYINDVDCFVVYVHSLVFKYFKKN